MSIFTWISVLASLSILTELNVADTTPKRGTVNRNRIKDKTNGDIFNIAISSRKLLYVGEDINGVSAYDNDRLYFGTTYKGLFEFNVARNSHKLVAFINGRVNAVATLSKKVYFGASDDNLYEYDPQTGTFKSVVKGDSDVISLAALENDLYFGTQSGGLFLYNPTKGVNRQVAVLGMNGYAINTITAGKGKVYFGSMNGRLFEFDPNVGIHKELADAYESVHGIATANDLVYYGSADNLLYEYNPVTTQRKIAARANEGIRSVIEFENKIYFGSLDDALHEYNPQTGKHTIVSRIGSDKLSLAVMNKKIYIGSQYNNLLEYDPKGNSSRVALHLSENINGLVGVNNKIYFGTEFGTLYEYDIATNQGKIAVFIGTGHWDNIYELATVNNKVYFGSQNDNLYELDPKSGVYKSVAYVNADIYSLTVYKDKIYYGTLFGNLYVYTPSNNENKFINNVGRDNQVDGVTALNNKIYFGTIKGELYEHDLTTGQQVQKVAQATEGIKGVTSLNNKIYFGSLDDNLYEYDPKTKRQTKVADLEQDIHSVIAMDNKIFFGADDGKLHVYNPATNHHKAVADVYYKLGGLTTYNNKVYFGLESEDLYEYYEKADLRGVIQSSNILSLKDTSDEAILNELAYYNPALDVSQVEIVEKTKFSAIIRAKKASNKYFEEKEIMFRVKNDSDDVVKLYDLVRRALYLSYKEDNDGGTLKRLRINLEDLKFSSVLASKIGLPTYHRKITKICFGTTILENNGAKNQILKTPPCKYKKETIIRAQILKGFNRFHNDLRPKATEIQELESYMLGGDEWPFTSVSVDEKTPQDVKLETGQHGDYGIWNSIYEEGDTRNLSKEFDLSNTRALLYTKSLALELPQQEIDVSPQNQIKLTASLEERTGHVFVNLKQTIRGHVEAQGRNVFNERVYFRIPIKKVMEKIKQNDMLPKELVINGDDSVSFNGVADVTLRKKMDASIKLS